MLPPPLSQAPLTACLSPIRLVATDMDGTLTQAGKFTSELFTALEALQAAGIQVWIITGRSAGWVSGLVSYLPIAGAIAENGGLYYGDGSAQPGRLLSPMSDIPHHRHKLAQTFEQLQAQFPQLQAASDNAFRVTDWTFDNPGFSSQSLRQMGDFCQAQGWGFTYSAVQGHILPLGQSKAAGLLTILRQLQLPPEQVLTVGDSPNDASLFDASLFPISVGVANVRSYLPQLQHPPTYMTQAAEGAGFCELTTTLLAAHKHSG
jgi:HAD superfamily hydrolase (TIGR01484 family)